VSFVTEFEIIWNQMRRGVISALVRWGCSAGAAVVISALTFGA